MTLDSLLQNIFESTSLYREIGIGKELFAQISGAWEDAGTSLILSTVEPLALAVLGSQLPDLDT